MAETSWAYTLDDGDDDSNTVPSKVTADNLKKYDISPQGQADEIRMVAEAVNNIGDNDGDGDKTNGANGNKATGVLSKTGSAVTAVGLAVVVLGAAGGVSFALRRKRSCDGLTRHYDAVASCWLSAVVCQMRLSRRSDAILSRFAHQSIDVNTGTEIIVPV